MHGGDLPGSGAAAEQSWHRRRDSAVFVGKLLGKAHRQGPQAGLRKDPCSASSGTKPLPLRSASLSSVALGNGQEPGRKWIPERGELTKCLKFCQNLAGSSFRRALSVTM